MVLQKTDSTILAFPTADTDSVPIESSHQPISTSSIVLTENLTKLLPSDTQPRTKGAPGGHSEHSISPSDLVIPDESINDQDPLKLCDSEPVDEEELIRCAGKLTVVTDKVKDLISTLYKDYRVHNRVELLTTIATFSTEIKSLCGDLASKAQNALNHELGKNEGKEDIITEILERNFQVSHDPGSRPTTLNDNQRRYLINLGPYQPKLSSFPKN